MTLEAQSAKPRSAQAPDPGREEIRVALALNGGVSLAVWMGGCAVELDRARRAGADPAAPSVYDGLATAFNRSLVIDILTGTSAGGINGALLAGAMATGRKLDAGFVRERWIKLGDLAAILHEPSEESPTALMDGEKFHGDLLKTFRALLGTEESADATKCDVPLGSRRAFVPNLDVTMTDVIGVERRFRDSWGGELIAREHRPRFRFRRREHFTEEALAAAARTSASFPFAFDPWKVKGNPRILAELPNPTYGIDGGLLDNAPIRDALDLIPKQPATTAVRRYVCYVNADPDARGEETIGSLPSLKQVGGYVLNLPRTAPLVDHLYAIREAVQKPRLAGKVQNELLALDLEQLKGVAERLFEAYSERRTLESLEEILPEPGDASATFETLRESGGTLPWIPRSWAPGEEERWEWGLLPAQRALHLLLDVLRPALAKASPAQRERLLATRISIYKALADLEKAHEDVIAAEAQETSSYFDEERAADLVSKAAARATKAACEIPALLKRAALECRTAMNLHPDLFPATREALFGPAADTDGDAVLHFLRRALSIEVVRRAFATDADVESTERLSFVQLTPAAPSPIFTPKPLQLKSPGSAAEKLTGVGLHHFAGFYRRSWRANDFMWGRLDAAARIVDLLLDSTPRDFSNDDPCEKPAPSSRWPEGDIAERAGCLAQALVDCAAAHQGFWLLAETLDIPADKAPPGTLDASEQKDFYLQPLQATIEAELRTAEAGKRNPMPLTRALFQRAAQLEIVCEELSVVREQSQVDHGLGAAAEPLELGDEEADNRVMSEIEAVRELYKGESSLPQKLTDPGEPVSTLGLQTITHVAFVALAAIRTAGVPMSKYLGFARPPLLAVAGTVAAAWVYRLTVVLGFWAASLYLTNRLITANPEQSVLFKEACSLPTLMALVAATGAAGLLAVPGLRAWRGPSRAKNVIYALFVLAAGGGVAVVAASRSGGFDLEKLLFPPAPQELPEWVLLTVLAVLGLVSLSRLPLPGQVSGILQKIHLRGKLLCLPLGGAFILLGIYAGRRVFDALDAGDWTATAAWAAFVGAPVVAALVVRLWQLGLPWKLRLGWKLRVPWVRRTDAG